MLKKLLLDTLTLQLDATTAYRQEFTQRFFIRGPIRSLNIGSGGGIETLRLLRRGNHVTVVEIVKEVEARTAARVQRNGFSARYNGVVGHFMQVQLDGPFEQIVMCEVLEHILDDRGAINKLASLLAPGGRLILSTPTNLYGQILDDSVSASEDGGHVRVGYAGPELDLLLAEAGLLCLKRFYIVNEFLRTHIIVDRYLRHFVLTMPFAHLWSMCSRPFLPCLDLLKGRPYVQPTIATKLK